MDTQPQKKPMSDAEAYGNFVLECVRRMPTVMSSYALFCAQWAEYAMARLDAAHPEFKEDDPPPL